MREGTALFPDAPTIYKATKLSDEDEELLDIFITLDSVYRVMLAPPKLPQERVAFLREAVGKTLTDPQLVAESSKRDRYIEYQPGKDVQQQMEEILKITGKKLEFMKYVWLEEFYK